MGNSDFLWKTCRVLANETRLNMLRRLLCGSERCVSTIAAVEALSDVAASQQLRMLHEYGFLQLRRDGKWVFYKATPNPAFPLAASLYPLLKHKLLSADKKKNEELIRIFTAFTHPRRIEMLSAIASGNRTVDDLVSLCQISSLALYRHLKKLTARKFIIQERETVQVVSSRDPLRTLLLDACQQACPYHTS